MILVFGGTGFVGKNLVKALLSKGQGVRVVSRNPDTNFLEAHAPEAEVITLERFMADPDAALFGVHTVVYAASTSTPGSNLDTPWREARDTVEAAMRVMSAVVRHSAAHVVYLSSGGTVYGQCADPMIREDVPLNPISPYGLGKKMTEAAIDFMARTQGLRVTVLRPSNPIGRWQMSLSQGVVGALMRAAKQETVFPMIGDGTSVRDYFDVRDLVSAIVMTLENPDASLGQIWNVGSGQGASVGDVLDLVQDISGKTITVEKMPARSTDVDRVVLDTSAIRTRLGWAPQYDLRQSLSDIWTVS